MPFSLNKSEEFENKILDIVSKTIRKVRMFSTFSQNTHSTRRVRLTVILVLKVTLATVIYEFIFEISNYIMCKIRIYDMDTLDMSYSVFSGNLIIHLYEDYVKAG